MKFGIQLYGPLGNMEGSVVEKLRVLALSGITEIEPCVSAKAFPRMEGIIWPAQWLLENYKTIESLGLTIPSLHFFSDNLPQSFDVMKALMEKTGVHYFVVKTPQDAKEIVLERTAEAYREAAEGLSRIGASLLLHNEAGDIAAKIAGKTAYERLLDLCDGMVGAQVDVGWVQFAGEAPLSFLERNGDRVKSLHYKDFSMSTREPVDVPIGTGQVDLAACFRFAQSRGIPQLIDQEHFGGDVPGELVRAGQLLNGFSDTFGKEET